MTEPQQPGSKKLPDFKKLEDRVIADHGITGPSLVIKTNVDPKDPSEDNPYFEHTNEKSEQLKEFFEE